MMARRIDSNQLTLFQFESKPDPAVELLRAAIRVLKRSDEMVHCENGICIVNGIEQTPDEVIEYAADLYEAEKNIPLHPRSALFGRPKKSDD